MTVQLLLPQFDELLRPQQRPLPMKIVPTPLDAGVRDLSWRRMMLRAFATCAIEAGYLQDDARTLALIPHLRGMLYDDVLLCGVWRLELLYLGSVGMPHFRLYWRGKCFGVADIYAEHADIGSSRKTPLVRHHLAAFLVFYGWTEDCVVCRPGTAMTSLEADVSRQYRLFNVTMKKKRAINYDLFKERAI